MLQNEEKNNHPKCKDWLVRYQCPLIIEEHDDGVKNTPFFTNLRVYKVVYTKIDVNT